MSYEIDVADTVPGPVFTLRRVIQADQVGTDIGVGLAELYAEVEAAGLHPVGPPSVTYLDPLNGRTHVDLGVAVAPRTRHVGPDTAGDPAAYRTEVSIPVLPSIGLSVRVEDGFSATVERTRKALGEGGFGILTEIDVRATLRERIGADIEEFLILGACDPRLAKLAIDIDRQAGVLLPCTVAVRADGDATVVEALDPAILLRASGLTELEPVAAEARERLAAALASLRMDQSWTG